MARRAPEPQISRADEARLREKTAQILAERARQEELLAMAAASSPTNNMGGKLENAESFERYEQVVLCSDGQVRIQPLRKSTAPNAAFIDQISFTFDENAVCDWLGQMLVTDDQYIRTISLLCESIFGFGITEECARGMNFYNKSWKLGIDDALYGHVSFGGQRQTVLIQITGVGAMAAHDGWEKKLFKFLSTAHRAKITRVDLARDFLNGEYTVDMANEAYDRGEFCSGGRWPSVEHHGNWKRPDGSGRTMYCGKRKSGKFTRWYEKGKQLGDKESPWTRLEVEFKSIDRVVPFDVLLHPGEYLAAAYPALDFISETPSRIEINVKRIELTYDKAIHYARLQAGRLINFMIEQAGLTAGEIIEQLSRPKAGYPKCLKLELLSADLCTASKIHEQPVKRSHDDFNMIKNYFGGDPLTV